MSRVALFVVALLFSLQAQAAPASAESVERALDLMHVEKTMDAAWPTMEAGIRKQVANEHFGRPFTPEQLAIDERTTQRAIAMVHEQLSWQTLKPQYVKIYRDTFTQEEIDGLIVFYSSPAGQAYLARMPLLMQKTMAIMQSELAEVMPRMAQIIRESNEASAAAAVAATASQPR
jgi:hypothetical protein